MPSLIERVPTEIGEAPPRALLHTISVLCPVVGGGSFKEAWEPGRARVEGREALRSRASKYTAALQSLEPCLLVDCCTQVVRQLHERLFCSDLRKFGHIDALGCGTCKVDDALLWIMWCCLVLCLMLHWL